MRVHVNKQFKNTSYFPFKSTMNSDQPSLINKQQVKRSRLCWLVGIQEHAFPQKFCYQQPLDPRAGPRSPIQPNCFCNLAFLLYLYSTTWKEGRKCTENSTRFHTFIWMLLYFPRIYWLLHFPKEYPNFLSPHKPQARRNHFYSEPSELFVQTLLITFYMNYRYPWTELKSSTLNLFLYLLFQALNLAGSKFTCVSR